ncbi:DUF1800 domain-containing protein [Aurantiacibacter marinus]|uniref:Uncharacterized protein n=1 Tax=Aurantiacibacter marinus TaxID=874156 RepID=A0A0H0XTD1_9SPHN|nr:DUF1800 domain-containing protein [Aurantiacibacter marinus]KLI65261.1 hypothetical protein AAV99_05140 [Aurantiacibacter marinus]
MTDTASIANDRFGLGATPQTRVPGDVRGWLAQQLQDFDPAPAGMPRLLSIEDLILGVADVRNETQMARRSNDMAEQEAARESRRDVRQRDRRNLFEASAARLRIAAQSETPFAERLVHFWSNHFAVSAERLPVYSLAAEYEFSAIRRNLSGNFADLLRAAVFHPAMLLFLDQTRSAGPNSTLIQRINRRRRNAQLGLNENLAREVLELHTMGVRSGYTQDDVVELARALTGWTVAGLGPNGMRRIIEGAPGETAFVEDLHEPGTRTVIGNRYSQNGALQAIAILGDLAMHPATARHLATKLARHFIADTPPESAIARLERAYLDSGGELSAVYSALIDAPEAWSAPRTKFRTPWDWMTASARALGPEAIPRNAQGVHRLMDMLGQPVWYPGNPSGWGDIASDWASPGALLTRVEVANRLTANGVRGADPRSLSAAVLGEALLPSTAQAIARAEAPTMGMALLLSSPEFMRR